MKTPAQWAKLHYDYGRSHPTTDKWPIEDFVAQIQDDALRGLFWFAIRCVALGFSVGMIVAILVHQLFH